MSGVSVTPLFGQSGIFRVYVRAPGQEQIDVTFFRDSPTQINSWSTADPFGDATMELGFPKISLLDRPGTGDMWWLTPWADVDIVHYNLDLSPSGWTWEGFIVSESIGNEGVTVQCKGALFMADNYLAKPTYPQRPIPYELLIRQSLDPDSYPLRTSTLVTEWPENWNTVVPAPGEDTLWFLRPWGVEVGQKWTGLTSRSTGGWEPMLTGYIQSLLAVMYTEDGGQWTIRKRRGRVPVLQVRPALRAPLADTLIVYAGAHGVDGSFQRDFTQSANVIYGQGQDLAGTQFSGQQVTSDGLTTYYEPFAALPFVYPAADTNPRFLPTYTRKESRLQLPQGIDAIAARDIAANQIRKFADPGFTGTISLKSDPVRYDQAFSRFLIQAGMSIQVRGLRGANILFHISECSVNLQDGSVNLTVDSKFRDALTVDEVMARTRDALDPVRLLQGGKFSTTVQDLVKPWSYASGSGCVPSGGNLDSTEFFTKLISPTAQFPWTDWTTKYPPKNYPNMYLHIGPKSSDANNNWSGQERANITGAGVPIIMSQAGSIRLSQFAAYDRDGNIMKVRFHVGIYGSSGISYNSTPMLPMAIADQYGYAASQHYPFFKDAFESMKSDGTLVSDEDFTKMTQGSDTIIQWGNYYEPSGYSPGLASAGSPKTGMLVDETQWSYDLSNTGSDFNKYSIAETAKIPTAGMAYVLIYCDDQDINDVYFLGRLYRTEASAS